MVTVHKLTKRFGNRNVVSDLSFEVRPSEIFAFLGANGSGKTTTIRCLLNIYKPTHGKVLIHHQEFHPSMAGMLGYLPEERGLYLGSRVLETLTYFGRIKGLSRQTAEKRALDYLEQVGLAERANTEIKTLSSGQQQKVQLGLTIINHPELLILDEPTKGLDPINRSLLMEQLLKLNRDGTTIVFITHQMEEVEQIASRLVMIQEGKRLLYGKVSEVRQQFSTNRIRVQYHGTLPKNDRLYSFEVREESAEISPNAGIKPQEILKFLVEQDLEIQHFAIAVPSLQEVFIQASRRETATKQLP